MGTLADLYDDTPRVRFLEALFDLAPIEFTASQAADQVGEHRASFYRIVDQLERDGLILRTSENPTRYRVNEEDPRFQVMAAGEAALRIIEASGPEDPPRSLQQSHKAALARTIQTVVKSASTLPPKDSTDTVISDSFTLVTP